MQRKASSIPQEIRIQSFKGFDFYALLRFDRCRAFRSYRVTIVSVVQVGYQLANTLF